jgi:hypothetical protein
MPPCHYGPPAGLPTADPFELILWQNVAHLAAPARRREAFEQLRRTVGTPAAILKAGPQALEQVTAKGAAPFQIIPRLRSRPSPAGWSPSAAGGL